MSNISSLYDALIKTNNKENQTTNFLLWLLQKLPTRIIYEIINQSGIKIDCNFKGFDFDVQYRLKGSCPDAILNFNDDRHLIIETKRFPDSFNQQQFLNHIEGAQEEFGENNVWFIFLSGDTKIPKELERLKNSYPRIGFLPWMTMLNILKTNENISNNSQILIEEFLIFAKHFKLGRLFSMKGEDIKVFLQNYPSNKRFEIALYEKFNEFLDSLLNSLIISSQERLTGNKDIVDDSPCLYKSFDIKHWHLKNSCGFIFLNMITEEIGVLFTGYQSKNEKRAFLDVWDSKYKSIYARETNLFAFSWIDEDVDDIAIGGGYFKKIRGTSNKQFDPTQLSEFKDYLYWGFSYPFEVEKMDSYIESLSTEFSILLDKFTLPRVKGNSTIIKKKSK